MQTPTAEPNVSIMRMALASIQRGRTVAPDFTLAYGTEGVGKSTFGSESEAPVFIAAERGTQQLDVARFPEPQTWQDILDAIDVLRKGGHEYRTVVIDTLDWCAMLLKRHVSKREGWDEGGVEFDKYGRGFNVWLNDWLILIQKLDKLQEETKMNVIVLAHAMVKKFKNPNGEDFDRYGMDALGVKTPDIFMRRAECVLFFAWEEFTRETSKGSDRHRGVSSNVRLMHTQRTAAWDAKNRYDLPATLPLDFNAYAEARDRFLIGDPDAILAELSALGKEKLTGDRLAKLETFLLKNKTNPAKLTIALNKLKAESSAQ